ncbi:SDR family NAD(P)-dependent oxidoreductase [Kineococcus sp. R8]|uniref:SDR family NAD(P)-dependent oxidoreductase n=1 Tax=Kineococcus siccus TaxID=2696567 RepID=UPI0014127FB7|nr:SDR family NAD(P)-dependent oxidoreductase [Kineococcus siccus]NAZ81779.1 SDR family NAD(P)-dependent oxidoreductase [Kineococcus siccus]
MDDGDLTGRVALVTGASRGVGKGIALGLLEAGATVYVTARTLEPAAAHPLGGSLRQTVAEAERLGAAGGRAIAVRCDSRDDDDTRALLARIEADAGRLDVLVTSAWAGYEHFSDGTDHLAERNFWTVPLSRWSAVVDGGARAQYATTVLAAPLLLRAAGALVVHVSSDASTRDDLGAAYSVAKAASDRMAACMAHDLRPHGAAAVSLWPGLVSTEAVLRAAEHFDMTGSESPRAVGRCVAALAADPRRLELSGQVVTTAALRARYAVVDPEPWPSRRAPGADDR